MIFYISLLHVCIAKEDRYKLKRWGQWETLLDNTSGIEQKLKQSIEITTFYNEDKSSKKLFFFLVLLINSYYTMKQKKVLHISNYYAPHIGGIEDVCKTLVNGMTNYEQRVLCFNEHKTTMITFDERAKVVHAGSLCKIASQSISVSLFKLLKKKIKEYCPDIVHVHFPNPLVAFYLLMLIPKDTKLVVHWHSDIVEQKVLYYFVRPFEKAILDRADKVIVTSPNYLDASKPLKRYTDKVAIVPCAISTEKLDLRTGEEQKVQALRLAYENRPIVFFLGRHVGYKGLYHLIEAEKHVKKDCVFLIAGSGPLTSSVKERAKRSKRIIFVGRIPDDEIRIYMHAASVFAFPSITKNEAFGISLAEALYCGAVPVTFTIKGSGVNWVNLDQITGLEVANKDEKSYAGAIDTLLSDIKLHQKMKDAARQRAMSQMATPVVCELMQAVYKSL